MRRHKGRSWQRDRLFFDNIMSVIFDIFSQVWGRILVLALVFVGIKIGGVLFANFHKLDQ